MFPTQVVVDFDIPQEAKSRHNTMVDKLSSELLPGELERLKNQFRHNPLNQTDINRIDNIFKLFEELMKFELIDYGRYDNLVSVLKEINPRASTLVVSHGQEIGSIIDRDTQLPADTPLPTTTCIEGRDQTSMNFTDIPEGHGEFSIVKETFQTTRASAKALEILLEHRCVVLVGKEGEGKTAIAKHLATRVAKACATLQIKYVMEDIDIASIRMMDQGIFVLDDLQYFPNPQPWIDFLLKRVQEKENAYLIITGSVDWEDTLKGKTSQILETDVSINLSDASYVLDDHDKEKMVQAICEMFQREDKLSGRISTTDNNTGMPFPLTVYHFFRNKAFTEKGVAFFQDIQCLLDKELYDLIDEDQTKVREAIIIALLCSETLPLKTDAASLRRILKNNHMEVPPRSFGQDKVDEEVQFLNGKCLKELGQRKCVPLNAWSYEAMRIFLLRKHFLLATETLDIVWILSKVYITDYNQENGVVRLENPDLQRILAKRLLTELSRDVSKDRETIMRHPVMSSTEFIDIIMKTPALKQIIETHERTHLQRGDDKALFLCLSALYSNENLCDALITWYKDAFTDCVDHALNYAVLCAAKNPKPNCSILQNLVKHGADMNFSSTDVPPPCALQIAAENHDDETVKFFLRKGAFMPQLRWHFWKFLKYAAKGGDCLICTSNLIQALLQSVNNELETNKYGTFVGETLGLQPYSKRDCVHFLFTFAKLFGINDALVKAFQKSKINLTSTNENGSNLFHVLLKSRLKTRELHKSLYSAGAATLQTAIINNANKGGEYAIHIAVRKPRVSTVQLLIDDLNADSTKTDHHEMNALHLCVTSEKLEDTKASYIASILMRNKCSPHDQNSDGKSAIDLAMDKGFKRIKTLCVLHGVDFDPNDEIHPGFLLTCLPRNQRTETLMHPVSLHARRGKAGLTPLLHSLQKGYYDWVSYFLDREVALAENLDLDGNTALHCCLIGKLSDEQKKQTIERLLNDGCNINSVNSQHETALCRALRYPGLVDIIEHTLTLRPNPNVKDRDGQPTTIIHKLVQSSFDDATVLEMIKIAFETNSLDNTSLVQNSNGLTYLQLALNERNRNSTARFLLKKCHQSVTEDSLRVLLCSCINSECHDVYIKAMCFYLIGIARRDNIDDVGDHIDTAADLALSTTRLLPKTLALLLIGSNAYLSRDVFQIALEKKKMHSLLVKAIKGRGNDKNWKQTDVVRSLLDSDDFTPDLLRGILDELMLYGVNVHDTDGSSLYHAVKGRTSVGKIKVLIDMGADKDYVNPKSGHTLAHICVATERSDECTISILEELSPRNINTANKMGETAIMAAVQRGKIRTLGELLRCGAHINMTDNQGKSVLHHCVDSPQRDLLVYDMLDRMGFMLRNGNKKDRKGRTPLHAAAAHSEQSRIYTILRLQQYGCDVDIEDNERCPPLLNALQLHGATPIIICERVCRVGVLLWLKAKSCRSALDICERNKHALSYEHVLLQKKTREDLLKPLKTTFKKIHKLLENEGDFTLADAPRQREAPPNLPSDLHDLIEPISHVLSERDLDFSVDNEGDYLST